MELFKLFGTIAVDTDEANRAIDDTAKHAEDSSKKTSNAFSGIGTAATTIGKTVLGAGVALGGAWVAAIEASREYRTELGMVDTAFQVAGHSSEAAKETYSDLNAVLGDSAQATEAAQQLAKVADSEKELDTWTGILTGVYATFGESLPIEGLAEAANHTAKVGEVQGSLADALEWSGITVDDFNDSLAECNTEQERQKLIMDTLNGTYSKASEQYKETNKDVMDANRANQQLADAFAELGRVGEPILTVIKTKVAEMVAVAVPMLESFIQKVKDLKQWIEDNQNTINNWVAVIIGASVSIGAFLLVMKWGTIMGAATKAINACRAAVMLFNMTMMANPIALVASLIAGLVAAFIYLWNTNKDFRQFWIDLWEKLKSVCASGVKWIKSKFNDLKGAYQTVKEVFGNIKKTITEKIEGAKEAVRKAVEKIKGFFDFDWKLPTPKVPSFSLKGDFSLKPPSVPKIGIKWNAEGGILNQPTIFGRTAAGTLLGGGESGAEAVAPIDVLQEYVRSAVKSENEGIIRTLIEQNGIMMDFLARIIPSDVLLDSGVLAGQLAPSIDRALADRWTYSKRGITR